MCLLLLQFKSNLATRFWTMICYKDIQNLLMFQAYNLKLNSRICLSILYCLYSTNQKTSSSIIRNLITDIKCLNIAKISRNLPKFNMEQHVLYTYTRKFVEAKFNYFIISLPCAQNKAHGNWKLCRVLYWGTRQRWRSTKQCHWPPSLPSVLG